MSLDSASIIHVAVLKREVGILQSKLEPTDTGHIHTTIRTLEWRIKEIEERGGL